MRITILLAGLAIMALSMPVAAEDRNSAATCVAGEQPIHRFPAWADKSDAICDYGFVEVNRRLADLLEAPSGAVNLEWLKAALGVPRFIQREGYAPNDFYAVNAGYQVALAGKNGWEMLIEAYERRREGAWGRTDDFDAKFLATGLTPQMEAENKGHCISEAEVLDRAIAAGWHYVPGGMESGTVGPIFGPGALATDDGRRLVLVNLSRTTELPPRETLAATCAWIFSFSESKETASPAPS